VKATWKSLLTAALILIAPALPAVLMRPLSVEELAQKSDLILQGVVLGKSCHRDPDGRIYTRVELRVAEIWKGAAPGLTSSNTLAIVHGGGTVGDERVEVSGQVDYQPGEEVVAFLVLNARGVPVTLGLAQGKFRVWEDRQTGEKFAHNLFHGAAETAGREPQDAAANAADPKPDKLSLAGLKQRVEEAGR
jgi:hypothetical protein